MVEPKEIYLAQPSPAVRDPENKAEHILRLGGDAGYSLCITTLGFQQKSEDRIRILRLLLEFKGSNTQTIARITSKTKNMIRLILRVSNRGGELSESNLFRHFHAFLMRYIKYVASALDWSKSEEAEINTLMRRTIKQTCAGFACQHQDGKAHATGMHNTLSEVIEAQKIAQVVRLSSSRAGRRILESIGCGPTVVTNVRCQSHYQSEIHLR